MNTVSAIPIRAIAPIYKPCHVFVVLFLRGLDTFLLAPYGALLQDPVLNDLFAATVDWRKRFSVQF